MPAKKEPSINTHLESVHKTVSESAKFLRDQFTIIDIYAQRMVIKFSIWIFMQQHKEYFYNIFFHNKSKADYILQMVNFLNSESEYVDPVSNVANKELLSMAWFVLGKSEYLYDQTTSDYRKRFLESLFEAEAERQPDGTIMRICSPGIFNKIVYALQGCVKGVNVKIHVLTDLSLKFRHILKMFVIDYTSKNLTLHQSYNKYVQSLDMQGPKFEVIAKGLVQEFYTLFDYKNRPDDETIDRDFGSRKIVRLYERVMGCSSFAELVELIDTDEIYKAEVEVKRQKYIQDCTKKLYTECELATNKAHDGLIHTSERKCYDSRSADVHPADRLLAKLMSSNLTLRGSREKILWVHSVANMVDAFLSRDGDSLCDLNMLHILQGEFTNISVSFAVIEIVVTRSESFRVLKVSGNDVVIFCDPLNNKIYKNCTESQLRSQILCELLIHAQSDSVEPIDYGKIDLYVQALDDMEADQNNDAVVYSTHKIRPLLFSQQAQYMILFNYFMALRLISLYPANPHTYSNMDKQRDLFCQTFGYPAGVDLSIGRLDCGLSKAPSRSILFRAQARVRDTDCQDQKVKNNRIS